MPDTTTTCYKCMTCEYEYDLYHHIDDDSIPKHCGMLMVVIIDA